MRKHSIVGISITMTLCFFIVLITPIQAAAAVKLTGWDLVDNTSHVEWEGSTRYQAEIKYAAALWNSYKKGVIRKRSGKMKRDVYISDYSKNEPVVAITSSRGTIRINTYNMKKLNDKQRKNVVIHEFGHTLGLAHNTKKDVISTYVTTNIKLSNNDKASYTRAYKNY